MSGLVNESLCNGVYRLIKGSAEDIANYPGFFQKYLYITIPLSVLYVVLVFGIREFMKTREKLNLRFPLFLWSFGLAVFSLFTVVGLLRDMLYIWFNQGSHHLLCEKWFVNTYPASYWITMFLFSKVLEFGDTFFIVLRKTPLSFLHVYHHFTVLILSWFLAGQEVPVSYIFGAVNAFVHTVMYGYYSLKVQRVYVPKIVSVGITTLQISQMVVCLGIVSYAFKMHCEGNCNAMNYGSFLFAAFIYFSYFVLFGNFFYQTYLKKKVISVKVKSK